MSLATAFVYQLEELAADVGRLRRRVNGDEYAAHLVDRIGGRVENLDAILWPTAGELVDDGYAIDAAFARVDRRHRQIQTLVGEPTDEDFERGAICERARSVAA